MAMMTAPATAAGTNNAPTSNSSLEYIFKPTTTPKSQLLLANTLGYPKSWHVQRRTTGNNTFVDTIYAGDPAGLNVDTYYNHTAAYTAALKWIEGESTPYDDGGGQMLARQKMETLDIGDLVEVFYEPDGVWYEGHIEKVTMYEDTNRYTVHYKEDDSTQANIYEDQMRLLKKKTKPRKSISHNTTADGNSNKKRKRQSTLEELAFTGTSTASSTPKAKRGRKPKSAATPAASSVSPKGRNYKPNPEGLKLATKMGLPEGWTATIRSNSRYTFRSPDGKLRFTSKREAFGHLGLPLPKHGARYDSEEDGEEEEEESNNDTDDNVQMEDDDNEEEMTLAQQIAAQANAVPIETTEIEEGDPPWRTAENSQHKYLGRKIKYQFDELGDNRHHTGTIIGWIAATDVDKDGEPGFISEKTGEASELYHVSFDSRTCGIETQDFEEYELLECLVDDTNDDADSEKDKKEKKHVLDRGRTKKRGPGRPRKNIS